MAQRDKPFPNAEQRRDRVVSIAGAVLSALVVLLATFRTDLYERERYVQTARIEAVQHASVLRARIEGALNARLHLAHGLAAFAKTNPFDIYDFGTFAEGLMQTGIEGIRSLQLAPSAVVSHVYPLKGNEAIIGHDLLADESRRETVKRTIRERLFMIAGPVKLKQGGMGLIARLPLFFDQPHDAFWGFATVVLDVDPILREGGLYPALDANFSASLRGKDALGAEGEVFFGDSRGFSQDPVLMQISLPHGSWQLAVVPAAGWPNASPFSPIIWLVGALLAFFAAAFVYARISEPARLRRQVERATRALAEREEQFRRVSESASDAIISCDSHGQVVFWNPAAERIFGFPTANAIGKSLADLVVPSGAAELHRQLADPSHMGERLGRVIETTARRRDGGAFPVELTLAQWRAGGETFFTAIVRDITDRKAADQAQALLRERYYHSQKMEAIGRLASGAAHEFNNTLNSLLANAEAALAELPPNATATTPLYEVLNCGWRAADIVRQLLVFSEKNDAETPAVSPYAAINQLLARLRAQLPANITLDDALEPVHATVALEFDQFCHMMWNLFMNACRAMVVSGGTLTVSLQEGTKSDAELVAHTAQTPEGEGEDSARLVIGELSPGQYLRLTVADTGCGMDQEMLSRIFDPFFTTAAVGNGTGLGLSVVHGVVQSQGGAIVVTSRRNFGTTFAIYLPSSERTDSDTEMGTVTAG